MRKKRKVPGMTLEQLKKALDVLGRRLEGSKPKPGLTESILEGIRRDHSVMRYNRTVSLELYPSGNYGFDLILYAASGEWTKTSHHYWTPNPPPPAMEVA